MTEASKWHSTGQRETLTSLAVNESTGLSKAEATRRLAQYGPNQIRKEKREPFWEEFLEEARQPMILLLFVTGIFYAVFGGLEDALVILAVIITLLSVEVVNESRAGKAISSLRKLAEPVALVRRDTRQQEIAVEEVVPGDIILLQSGRRVPADARLVEAYGISMDESSLTGESAPVEKSADIVLPNSTALAERSNMVYAGTTLVRGRGTGTVVATGISTELGRIGKLASETKPPATLLQRTMNEITRWMVWLAIGFSAIVPLLGWLLVHQPPQQMLLTGLSLAFATIPEELPIIITMVLALGAYRLSKKHAIVKQLQAVETLGAVTVIASDKTGTLTENRMQLKQIFPESVTHRILEIGILCNDATTQEENSGVDPLETALLENARRQGIDIESTRKDSPLVEEYTFDNTRKMMSVVRGRDQDLQVLAKGAPEAILARSKLDQITNQPKPLDLADQDTIRSVQNQMAAEGLRVIAFAEGTTTRDQSSQETVERDLTFIGLAGFADVVRPEVKDAVSASRAAGVRTLMVTGDHPLTANAIAKEIGLDNGSGTLTGVEIDTLSENQMIEAVMQTSVYARTTPEEKLRIVKALHSAGEVVAVTGDGINDAPALAAADIGIAMGKKGTDVARETAGVVLSDDNYSTIVGSVAEGRTLFANLTKGVRYYLTCKVALISSTLLPILLLVPVPFAPIQIILMELFMDLAAAATFVAEPADLDTMKKPPRNPRAKFLDRQMVLSIFKSAAGLFLAVVTAYLITWYTSNDLVRAQTVAFATWLIGHVFLALNMRSEKEPLLKLGLLSNKLMAIWVIVTLSFVGAVTLLPGVQEVFKTTPLGPNDWLLLIPLALAGTFWLEIQKLLPRSLNAGRLAN